MKELTPCSSTVISSMYIIRLLDASDSYMSNLLSLINKTKKNVDAQGFKYHHWYDIINVVITAKKIEIDEQDFLRLSSYSLTIWTVI